MKVLVGYCTGYFSRKKKIHFYFFHDDDTEESLGKASGSPWTLDRVVDRDSWREKWAAYGSLLLPQKEPPMAPCSWHKENIGCDNDPLGSLYIHNLSELRLESEGHEPTSERSPSEAGHHCHQDPEHTWHLGIITVITSWHRTQAWTLLADVLLTKT